MLPHCIVGGFTHNQEPNHNPAFHDVREFKMEGPAELVDLAETEGASRKATKAMECSPQVTQFVNNIMGFLEIFRSFYGIFRGETGDF